MARLGKLFIAGKEEFGGRFKSGVSYSLAADSLVPFLYQAQRDRWCVEFMPGSSDVVARTDKELSLDEVQAGGFAAIQEALDILAVKGVISTSLAEPSRSNISVYWRDGRSVLSVYSLFDFAMGLRVEVTQVDASGNEVKLPAPPEPIWNESFRYYRLSQCSNDLFDAYRSLFLAFEAMLNSICRKKGNEREGEWLRRSLSAVNSRTSLAQFTPTGKEDPVAYIIASQYKSIRCRLQHAKFPDAQLPHSQKSPSEVKQAYSELARIWRYIAGVYFHTESGGGVITYLGFLKMMENTFGEGVSIYYTSDKSPPAEGDTEVSPSGVPAYQFDESSFEGQVNPGVVRVIGRDKTLTNVEDSGVTVHRHCTRIKSALFGVAYIEAGLRVIGVDEWECVHDFRLVNSSQPKVNFRT